MKNDQFRIKSIFFLSLIIISASCLNSKDLMASGEPSLEGKKVLLVWGGWPGHEPEQCKNIFVPWMESEGAEVIVSDSLGVYTNKELMKSLDLIVQVWTMGKISKEEEAGLLAAVNSGVGLAGWHGGLGDSFRNNTAYQFMVGGQWVAHPGGVLNYVVDISNKKDPVTHYGEGRVFYSSLGHVASDFQVPEVLEIMKRGIRWSSESKYMEKEKWMSPVY